MADETATADSWLNRRRRRRAARAAGKAELARHDALVGDAIARADFTDIAKFYRADERRRGDDETVGEVADGELLWSIGWLPGTGEVVAFAHAWADERAHRWVFNGGDSGSAAELGSVSVPQLVNVLGTAVSAEIAWAALEGAAGLEGVAAHLRRL